MVILAGVFGAVASGVGSLASVMAGDVPTGPAIVLTLSVIVAVSLLFAPHRSLVIREIRIARQRRRLIRELDQEDEREAEATP
jgi:manganese/zinc/iron transport system permease protein